MPTSSDNQTGKGNTATSGDHDRVAMLSLKADGTPDQTRPEFIDPEATKDATRKQFAEQAVSAADVEARGATAGDGGTTVSDAPQDPSVKELAGKHEKAQKAGHKAADAALKALAPKEDSSSSSSSSSGSSSGGSGSSS